MDHWIRHPSEPKELILVWQAPSSVEDRLRWAVGRVKAAPSGFVFDYLEEEEFRALNEGRNPQELQAAGYAGYPAFDVKKRSADGFRDHVIEALLRRLPPSTRSDFGDFLAYFRIPSDTKLSPLGLLAATEARLPGDGFSFIDPLDPMISTVDVVLEIAGFRHYAPHASPIALGAQVTLSAETFNTHDPHAVAMSIGGAKVGYVNRLQAPSVRKWLEIRSVNGWISRLNGRPDAPRAFAFVEVRPHRSSVAA